MHWIKKFVLIPICLDSNFFGTNNFICMKYFFGNKLFSDQRPNIHYDQQMLFGEVNENSSVALLSSTCFLIKLFISYSVVSLIWEE